MFVIPEIIQEASTLETSLCWYQLVTIVRIASNREGHTNVQGRNEGTTNDSNKVTERTVLLVYKRYQSGDRTIGIATDLCVESE